MQAEKAEPVVGDRHRVISTIEAARIVGLSESTLAQTSTERQRAGLLQAGTPGSVSPGGFGRVAPVSHHARHVRRRRAVSKGVDSRPPALSHGGPSSRDNPRLAKIHRSYSVEEIARLFKLHKNTVRAWLRQRARRPSTVSAQPWSAAIAFRGFLSERRDPVQATVRSRAHLLPAVPRAEGARSEDGRMRERPATTNGTLQEICPDCNRMIYRRINPQKIGAVRGDLDVTFTQAEPRLGEMARPNVNCDFTVGEQR